VASRSAKPVKRDGAVYSAVITLKNGRKLYASSYGLKAFCFYPKSAKRKR
jgi:hypothetical protein